jgi:FkbM family methyltransferase
VKLLKRYKKYARRHRLARLIKHTISPGAEFSFLPWTRGVIHVGANTGQERDVYGIYGIPVLWIEPIPEVFVRLTENIRAYPEQQALQALLADKDGSTVEFYLADNDGMSSSMLTPHLHKSASPIKFDKTIALTTTTFESLAREKHIDLKLYNALVLDTQGSELLILRGAKGELHNFDIVKAEIIDFEAYVGAPKLVDFAAFMESAGFEEMARECIFKHELGMAFDVTYRRRSIRFTKMQAWRNLGKNVFGTLNRR